MNRDKCSVLGAQCSAEGRLCPSRPVAAFTLIELLVVIALIAVLVGITLAAVGGVQKKAALDRTKAEIAAIVNAMERYKMQNDKYPDANGSNVPYAAISAFLPMSASSIQGTGTTASLVDSYGNPYYYRFPGTINIATFDVWSAGHDSSQSATNDDIGNW